MPTYKAKQVLRDLEKKCELVPTNRGEAAIKSSETPRQDKLQLFRRTSGEIFRSILLKRFIDSWD